uniref:Mto2 n=1 Tax=Schizosaccharomyces pombe TaxID=4896 RepID=UPI0010A94DFC|nr:Chain A, Mto2 [Schizosaccharomyces pombe]6GDJ_B Chain B, Mto2 [Schizosaccharomyces pombe]
GGPAPLSTMQTALMRLRTYHPSPIILKPVEQAVNHAITLVNTSPSSVVDALCRSLAELCLGLVQEAIDASILSQQESSNSLDLVRHTP